MTTLSETSGTSEFLTQEAFEHSPITSTIVISRAKSNITSAIWADPVEGTTLSYQNGRELPGGSHAISVFTGVSAPTL